MNREFNKLFFVTHDQMVVRTPRKTRINNRYSWFYYLFFPDFQFRDLRKINKDHGSIKWKWWIFVSCYLQSRFLFSPRSNCFSDTLFFAYEQVKKRYLTFWLFDSKTEMKVWYPWFVIGYFFICEPCQRPAVRPCSVVCGEKRSQLLRMCGACS